MTRASALTRKAAAPRMKSEARFAADTMGVYRVGIAGPHSPRGPHPSGQSSGVRLELSSSLGAVAVPTIAGYRADDFGTSEDSVSMTVQRRRGGSYRQPG
jgi:hypothetical protein